MTNPVGASGHRPPQLTPLPSSRWTWKATDSQQRFATYTKPVETAVSLDSMVDYVKAPHDHLTKEVSVPGSPTASVLPSTLITEEMKILRKKFALNTSTYTTLYVVFNNYLYLPFLSDKINTNDLMLLTQKAMKKNPSESFDPLKNLWPVISAYLTKRIENEELNIQNPSWYHKLGFLIKLQYQKFAYGLACFLFSGGINKFFDDFVCKITDTLAPTLYGEYDNITLALTNEISALTTEYIGCMNEQYTSEPNLNHRTLTQDEYINKRLDQKWINEEKIFEKFSKIILSKFLPQFLFFTKFRENNTELRNSSDPFQKFWGYLLYIVEFPITGFDYVVNFIFKRVAKKSLPSIIKNLVLTGVKSTEGSPFKDALYTTLSEQVLTNLEKDDNQINERPKNHVTNNAKEALKKSIKNLNQILYRVHAANKNDDDLAIKELNDERIIHSHISGKMYIDPALQELGTECATLILNTCRHPEEINKLLAAFLKTANAPFEGQNSEDPSLIRAQHEIYEENEKNFFDRIDKLTQKHTKKAIIEQFTSKSSETLKNQELVFLNKCKNKFLDEDDSLISFIKNSEKLLELYQQGSLRNPENDRKNPFQLSHHNFIDLLNFFKTELPHAKETYESRVYKEIEKKFESITKKLYEGSRFLISRKGLEDARVNKYQIKELLGSLEAAVTEPSLDMDKIVVILEDIQELDKNERDQTLHEHLEHLLIVNSQNLDANRAHISENKAHILNQLAIYRSKAEKEEGQIKLLLIENIQAMLQIAREIKDSVQQMTPSSYPYQSRVLAPAATLIGGIATSATYPIALGKMALGALSLKNWGFSKNHNFTKDHPYLFSLASSISSRIPFPSINLDPATYLGSWASYLPHKWQVVQNFVSNPTGAEVVASLPAAVSSLGLSYAAPYIERSIASSLGAGIEFAYRNKIKDKINRGKALLNRKSLPRSIIYHALKLTTNYLEKS